MKGVGMFGRGNINANISESIYIISPLYIFIGVMTGLFLQAIVLAISYWGFEATETGILLILILMGGGDLFFVAVTVYGSRLYLREEMVDMASLFASYNPQILNAGGPMIQNAMQAVKDGRADAMSYATLISELEQLQQVLQAQQDLNQPVPQNAPLPGLPKSGSVAFTPFIDAE